MFSGADYSFKINDKGLSVVVIDLHDGFTAEASEKNLLQTIRLVKERRLSYSTDDEWRNVLSIYKIALAFLREQIAVHP